MQDVTTTKNAGAETISAILDARSKFLYGAEHIGTSTRYGSNSDKIAFHLDDAASTTNADTLLTAIALPTCTSSLLAITANVGTFIVSDVTNVTAHSTLVKTIKITVGIDDTTGVLEIIAYEKTDGEYAAVPLGKSHVADLKEYTLAAAGTEVVESVNFIK